MVSNWQYHTLKTMSRMISSLPYTFVLQAGKWLGKLYYRLAGRQRNRAIAQIMEGMSLSAAESETIIKSLFTKIGQTFLEIMYTPALTPQNFQRYVSIENMHYFKEALAERRGVVILTAHVGNWEWLGAGLALSGLPITSVIKRQPNDQHTRLLNEYREMVGIEIFARGTTELVAAAKAMKKGKGLGFLADQDAGKSGIFVDFFGKPASTPIGPAVFARRFKAPVVPCYIVRKKEGGHRLIIHKPFYYEDTGNESEDIRRLTVTMTNHLETFIRSYPDEWLWFQKRWNTKPDDESLDGREIAATKDNADDNKDKGAGEQA
ncbi:hypothetical protein P22_0591 [Propionispora sp. 2/2-37]|uniref:lysophospholipid acyltransferase family protein n=1 Tax=Propionispora sp. 2/2-37 TaxID=1677858 RepID=UPI0006C38CB6|nr:lysophospholipid acyltransferase family protein [Propionispora sp. 2/2-37]CUH94525.1 hypothetical protein P22_0591 [Propionispora sp. 2/2-37]